MNIRVARNCLLTLLAAAAAASVSLAFATGAAGAIVTVNCPPFGVQTAADVQAAANGGGTVNIRGVCAGTVDLTAAVTLAGVTPGATSGLDGSSAPGAPVVTVDATPVTLTNLLVTGGVNSGDGGGVWDVCGWDSCGGGVLNILGSRVTGNTVTGVDSWGAGINAESDTTVNVKSTYVTGNTTTAIFGNGAGIASDDATAVNLIGDVVSGNSAADGEGGGVFIRGTGKLAVTTTTIAQNAAAGGGGIASAGSNVSVVKSNILSNGAEAGAGILEQPGIDAGPLRPHTSPVLVPPGFLTVDQTTFDHNQAEVAGGGVLAASGCGTGSGNVTVVITTSTFTANSTLFGGAGGGGYAQSAGCNHTVGATITDTLLSGNTAVGSFGGAISNTTDFVSHSSVTLQQSALPHQMMTVTGNQADFGGGIYNSGDGATVTLRPATRVTKNHANVDGGGVFDDCGALYFLVPGAQNVFNTPDNLAYGSCI